MNDEEFFVPDEPAEDVHAAFERGKKGRTRRRLDSVFSVRFTADQLDRIRAVAGDNISGFVRQLVLDTVYPPVPVRTYRCEHMSMSGRFVEPPACLNGCVMSEQPVTQTTWGGKVISVNLAA